MERIITRSSAKLNLSLDITGVRPDGYHDIVSIMHEIPLHDDIEINIDKGDSVRASTNLSYIQNEKNLAMRASKLFLEHIGEKRDISVHIEKRIPVGAGLGGGSSDAAAVFVALNEYFSLPLTTAELCRLATPLGADIPFCITGGCALCEGIGDILTPLPALPRCSIVLVKPPISLSTPEMFRRYDGRKKHPHPDTHGLIEALENGDITGVSRRIFNVMEQPAQELARDISELRLSMLRLGALGACMSGSGSTVYGIYDDSGMAEKAERALRVGKNTVFRLEM